MARVIDIKCPTCAAPLPIAADATTITCRYCGGTSAIERPGKAIHAPPGQTVVHVPAAKPGRRPQRRVGVADLDARRRRRHQHDLPQQRVAAEQARPGAPEAPPPPPPPPPPRALPP
jgi:ribosomal protein S27E